MHHRALIKVYQDKKSSFEELMQTGKSVSVHMKKLQDLATEISKLKNGFVLIIMNEIFNFQENKIYSLRGGIHLASINMHTAHSVLTLYLV